MENGIEGGEFSATFDSSTVTDAAASESASSPSLILHIPRTSKSIDNDTEALGLKSRVQSAKSHKLDGTISKEVYITHAPSDTWRFPSNLRATKMGLLSDAASDILDIPKIPSAIPGSPLTTTNTKSRELSSTGSGILDHPVSPVLDPNSPTTLKVLRGPRIPKPRDVNFGATILTNTESNIPSISPSSF